MSSSVPYLGKPGKMIALPVPAPGATFDPTRGEAVFGTSAGGSFAMKRLQMKHSYSLAYDYQNPISSDLLMGIYGGLFDEPLTLAKVFVDMTVRNVLTLDASSCGQRSQAPIVWNSVTGTVTPSTSITSPVAGSGVLTWAGAANNSLFSPYVPSYTPSPVTEAPVYLPAEPVSFSIYVQANSAHPIWVQLAGCDVAGNQISGATLRASFTTSTVWQRFSITLDSFSSMFASSVFVVPLIVMPATGTVPSSLSIAAPQVEYGYNVTAWQPGQGSPRVDIISTIGRAVQMFGTADHTLVLAER